MNEKKIIMGRNSTSFYDADLNYVDELEYAKKNYFKFLPPFEGANDDQIYLIIQNSCSPNNTYTIVETSIDDENKIIEQTFYFNDYNNWDHNIYEFTQYFKRTHHIYPNIFLGNEKTIETIDLYMSKKLLETRKENEIKRIDKFVTKDFELQICMDFDLENHRFTLIYDEQAQFVSKEDNEEVKDLSHDIDL